jgi:hypothetical protein
MLTAVMSSLNRCAPVLAEYVGIVYANGLPQAVPCPHEYTVMVGS